MKYLIAVILIFALSGCASSPHKDIYIVMVSVWGIPHLVEFEKGEFDLTDKERGYRIFDSEEELFEAYPMLDPNYQLQRRDYRNDPDFSREGLGL